MRKFLKQDPISEKGVKTSPIKRGFLFIVVFIIMTELEEKYNLLMGFLLPRVNKCIDSFDEIKLVQIKLLGDSSLLPILEPRIKINVKSDCLSNEGYNGKLALRGEVFGEVLHLNELYFPDSNIVAVIDYITVND